MDASLSDVRPNPTKNLFGLSQQIVGVALFVGVIMVFNWNLTLLRGPDDPWGTAVDAVKQRSYHWAVIPLALLAVAGAAVAVAPGHNAIRTRRFFNRSVLGAAIFAGSIIVIRINPGLVDTFFVPNWGSTGDLPWKISYHWALVPLIVVGIASGAVGVIPQRATGRRTLLLNRQVVGILVFAGAFFVLHSIPGLIVRGGTGSVMWTRHHWAIIPVVMLAVVGATLAVMPRWKSEAPIQKTQASSFALSVAWALAAYPLAVIAWFYLYVFR